MIQFALRIFNAYKGDEYISRQEKILLAILAVLLAKYEKSTNIDSYGEGPYGYGSQTR